jgi:hypothetical protein
MVHNTTVEFWSWPKCNFFSFLSALIKIILATKLEI